MDKKPTPEQCKTCEQWSENSHPQFNITPPRCMREVSDFLALGIVAPVGCPNAQKQEPEKATPPQGTIPAEEFYALEQFLMSAAIALDEAQSEIDRLKNRGL